MTNQQINNLARIAAETTVSLLYSKKEKDSVDLFLKAYEYAKQMITLKQIHTIEVPEGINKIAQAAAQAFTSWHKNILSVENEIEMFLNTYELIVRHFMHCNIEFKPDSEELMDMCISSVRTVISSHNYRLEKN